MLFLLIESPFVPTLAIGWCWIAAVELDAVLIPVVVGNLLRWFTLAAQLRAQLRPLDRWHEASPQQLCDTAIRFGDFAKTLGIGHTIGWICLYIGQTVFVWFWCSDVAPIGVQDLGAIVFFLLALASGAMLFSFAVGSMLIVSERKAIARTMYEQGVQLPLAPVSLVPRINAIMLTYVLAPASLIAAGGWASHTEFKRRDTVARLSAMALQDRHRVEHGLAPLHASMVEANEQTAARVPNPLVDDDVHVVLDRRLAHAQVGVPLDDGRWLLVETDVSNAGAFPGLLLLLGGIAMLWGLITSVIITRALIEPLVGIEATMRRLVEIGDIHEQALPVTRHDEIGMLARCYNDLVANFRTLAETARNVARGQLSVTLEQRGDLPDAFRGMVEQLDEIVGELRETASELVSTTEQIHASTQEQELAAQRSSASVGEVRGTVTSLESSARDIEGIADDVRTNAERTLATTEATTVRIGELRSQVERINRLLEFIREIADRSDLLALNGALEATRAGEAGRGFALVAEEMRRLAERVTHTVADVHALVGGIEKASAATVLATKESRDLAQATAQAALQIVTCSRQQSVDTVRATAIVETMAELVVASSRSTTQTRGATMSLHGRVETLRRVLRRFELRER